MFQKLEPKTLEQIASHCKIRSLEKGEYLCRAGDPVDGVYIIQTGYVSLERNTSGGRVQAFHILGFGHSIGGLVIQMSGVYPFSATAIQPTQAIMVPRTLFQDLAANNPTIAEGLLAEMAGSMEKFSKSIHALMRYRIQGRLALWLLSELNVQRATRLGDDDYDDESGIGIVDLKLSKKLLAAELGVSGATLSRTFATFRDECIIHIIKKRIYIIEQTALEAYAKNTDHL